MKEDREDSKTNLLSAHELTIQLEEAQETLRAIRNGEIDALLIRSGGEPRVYTLKDADYAYRTLFETLNEGALTLSSDGTILFANTRFAALVQTPLDVVMGSPFTRFVADASVAHFRSLFEAGSQGNSKGEIALRGAGGGAVPVMVSMNAVKMEGLESTCTMVVTDLTELKQAAEALRRAHDELEGRVLSRTAELSRANEALQTEITQRKRLESELRQRAEQLAEADRRKDEFLSMLAHELRNPLAPIFNSVRALDILLPKEASLLRHTEIIERQIKHLARLVDDLLDVARITRGAIVLSKEEVHLGEVVSRAAEATGPLIESQKHTLTVTIPEEPIWLDADPTRLEQVLVNLLINAAKYSEPGGKIWLTATREDDWVEVRVKDTGIGIAKELLPQIFGLFVQGQRSLDRSQGGLGIGLTLVKNLVEMHGGRIEAFSDGPRKGSEFVLRLPRKAEAVSVKSELKSEAPKAEQRSPGAPLRVLIVEDNIDAAETLAEVLELSGHKVRVTHDGPAAMEAVRSDPPEVVLCDLGLPGMNGYEVVQRIQELPLMAGALLVALTGYGQSEDRRRAMEAGFHLHLTKPIDPEQLADILAGVK